MYFEKNVQALGRENRHAALIARLQETVPAGDVVLDQTAAGDYTLQYRGVWLHDQAGAEAEARALFAAQGHPDFKSQHFCFGLGLGYLLQVVYDASPGAIFLYEPDLPFLRFILENVDLSDYLAAGRVSVLTTPQALIDAVEQKYTPGDTVDVLYLPAYARLWGDDLARLIREDLMGCVVRKKNSVMPIFLYLQDWNRQFCHNMRYFPLTEPLTPYENRFEGKPAVVVSAGPSLERSMDALRQAAGAVVIVAVGAALRPLLAAGIRPNFVAFMDFQGPARQLHDLAAQTADSVFLLGPFSESACYQAPAARYIQAPLQTMAAHGDWWSAALGENRPALNAGGTVSMLAFSAAVAMGCNPVALLGQDLALSNDGQVYAGRSDARIEGDEIVMDDSPTQLGKRLALVDVPGWQGEVLKTTPDYAQYIPEFSELARREKINRPGLALYNASQGGAQIDGFENTGLAEWLARYASAPLDKTLPPPMPQGVLAERFERVAGAVADLSATLKETLAEVETVRQLLTPLVKPGLDEAALLRGYQRYRPVNQQLMARLSAENSLLHYFIQRELWLLYRAGQDEPRQSLADIQACFRNEAVFYRSVADVLGELLGVLDDSLSALRSRSACC